MNALENGAGGIRAIHSVPVLRFLAGVLTIVVAGLIGGIVVGYFLSFIWAGPHAIWQPIDKNIGLDCAIDGIIAGNIAGIVWLAWLSNRRQSRAYFHGGLATIVVEVALFLLLVGPRAF